MNSIDLHGVKHENVGSILDAFIWENMKLNKSGVKIITGNSEYMKNIVYEIAEEYGFTVAEGYFNTGELIINFI